MRKIFKRKRIMLVLNLMAITSLVMPYSAAPALAANVLDGIAPAEVEQVQKQKIVDETPSVLGDEVSEEEEGDNQEDVVLEELSLTPGNGDEKYTICHATESEKNPYIRIIASTKSQGGHFDNDGNPTQSHALDILLEGEQDCPGGEEEPEPTDAKVIAHKIMCETEADLPNLSGSNLIIDATFAENFVEASQGNCWFEEGWDFQWAYNVDNPGDNLEYADGWNTFGSTDEDGMTMTSVDVSENSLIKVREALKEGYLPFSGIEANDPYSAEVWCHDDVFNYDNYDYIRNAQPESEYYCVAFNTRAPEPEPEGEIQGYKFHDLNGNGEWDKDEPALSGWEINLWSSCSEEALDFDGDQELTLDDAVIFTGYLESNDLGADVNNDGVVDIADKACADDAYSDTILDTVGPSSVITSQITDQNGYYSFGSLVPGTYWLNETMQEGWYQTLPGGNGVYGPIVIEENDVLDGYYFGNIERKSEDFPISIVAHKIVCLDEANLPNWSHTDTVIDNLTAQNFVEQNEGCWLEEGWNFQWAIDEDIPYDHIGEAENWNTFGPTDEDGMTYTIVDVPNGTEVVMVREVYQSDYIQFTGVYPVNDVSAEMYCHTDVSNYDNVDYITDPEAETTYYCVAFNVPRTEQCSSLLDYVDNAGNAVEDQEHSLSDAVVFTSHYLPALGATTTSANWDAEADVNLDGRVSEADYWCAHKYYSTALYECPIDCSNICGNGIVEDGEQCDDENREDGDGCNQYCELEREIPEVWGYKFHDLNKNSEWDEEEPGLEGWEINLWVGCSEEALDYDGDKDLSLDDATVFTAHYTNGEIEADVNLDTVVDEADKACADDAYSDKVLDEAPSSVIQSVLTDETGYYNFGILEPGTYWLNETLKENWTQTLPGGNGIYGPIVVEEDGDLGGYYFGNVQNENREEPEYPEVWGFKYKDVNNNGEWNEGEPALSGWEINLWSSCSEEALDYDGDQELTLDDAVIFTGHYENDEDEADVNNDSVVDEADKACADDAYSDTVLDTVGPSSVITSQITDETGYYNFGILEPGTYWLNETLKDDWTQTQPGGNGVYGPIVVEEDGQLDPYYFGNYIREDEGCQENCGGSTGGSGGGSTGGGGGIIPSTPRLVVNKVANPTTVDAGGQVTYTVTINNTGNQVGANLSLVDTLPAGFTFNDGGGVVKEWNWTTISPNELIQISYVVNVSDDAQNGTYTNIVVADIDNGQAVQDDADVVVGSPTVLGDSIDLEENPSVLGFEELPNTSGGFDWAEMLAMFSGLLAALVLVVRNLVPKTN